MVNTQNVIRMDARSRPGVMMTFDEWWRALFRLACRESKTDVIRWEDKESYREYYDDGDTIQHAFQEQIRRFSH